MALVNGLGGEEERLEGSHGAYRSAERTKRSRGALLGRRHTFCHTSEFSGAPRIQVPLFWPMCALLSRVTRRMTIDAQNWRFRLGRPSHLNACSWPFCIWQVEGCPAISRGSSGWRVAHQHRSQKQHVPCAHQSSCVATPQCRRKKEERGQKICSDAGLAQWWSNSHPPPRSRTTQLYAGAAAPWQDTVRAYLTSTQQLRNEG